MRKLAIIFSLGISVIIACSSNTTTEVKVYFEGKITFKNEYIIKTNKVDSAHLESFFGQSSELYFKEGNYLEKYSGGYMRESLYNKQNNKSYAKLDDSDTLHWTNCGILPGQKMLRFEINPKKEIILGINCDELITYYDNKTVSFYYNSDSLKINPDWYKDYTLYYKNINVQKMKAVYLKYKIERPDYIATVTATSISRQAIVDTLFSVPKNKILIETK